MYIFADSEQSRVSGTGKTVSEPRIGHVNLRVADLNRAISFYGDVLGLKIAYYGPAIGVPIVFMTFGDYHHHIALNWFYNDGGKSKHNYSSGLNHFAVVYPDEAALAKTVDRFLEHGGSVEDARDHGCTLSVYLRDPDGNGIELYYDRPRTQWFESTGQLVIKSEPFDTREWVEDVLEDAREVVRRKQLVPSMEVAQ
jgi:catechol 2,3-dioxygenase